LLKGYTEHWMIVFGPLIVAMALLGKSGIAGLLHRLDQKALRAPEASRSMSVPAAHPVHGGGV